MDEKYLVENSYLGLKTQYQAKVMFINGISESNYSQVIKEKVRPYETDGWKACLNDRFDEWKLYPIKRYQVTFVRQSDKD